MKQTLIDIHSHLMQVETKGESIQHLHIGLVKLTELINLISESERQAQQAHQVEPEQGVEPDEQIN